MSVDRFGTAAAVNAARVSVIVPCHNAAPYIRQMLESLVNQSVAEPTEIIVIDNGSSDASLEQARAVRGQLPVRVFLSSDRRNASYARNFGASVATGDKLLFVDADDDVAAGYVQALSEALEQHEFVTSCVDSITLNEPWVRDAQGEPWQQQEIGRFFDYLPATGVNIGIRRSLFERIGGFPEEFSGSQDIVFSWRAQHAGASIVLVKHALYRYRYRHSLRGLFRQSRNWGSSNVLLFKQFRGAGMPPRTWPVVFAEWRSVMRELAASRTRAELAPAVVRLGYCVGRLRGSIRHRVLYL